MTRIVLAYSGGLESSIAIPWLAERHGAEIIAVTIDLGQGKEALEEIRDRALATGALRAHVVDVRSRLIHGQFRFVSFLASEQDRSLARGGVRLEILFELRQDPPCLFQGELILPGIDRTRQFVLLDIQLGPPHAKPGFKQLYLVLRCLHLGISHCLGNFLLGLHQFGAVLLQLVVLFAGIEFEDDVALPDRGTCMQEPGDVEGAAANRRSRQGHRMAGAQFARGVNLEIQVSALNLSGWNLAVRCRKTSPARESQHSDDSKNNQPERSPRDATPVVHRC
jgi:hypothetical protein